MFEPTVMADVTDMPSNSFGYVPTPALVAPIEFTMRLSDYLALGGHADSVRPIEEAISDGVRRVGRIDPDANPVARHNYRWPEAE